MRADERPFVCEEVTVFQEALDGPIDVRKRLELTCEPLADRASAFVETVRHQLDGVLCIQLHAPVEVARVVALDVTVENLAVCTHAGTSSRTSMSDSSPCKSEKRLNVTTRESLSMSAASAGDGSP